MTILKRFKLLVTLTLLSLTSCIRPPEVTLYKNLAYSSYRFQGREETLLLDLYLPEASAPLPVLVYIHGGGWREGSKTDCPGEIVAQRGYAMACINYRFSDRADFPAQIYDVKQAVRWLRAKAATYQLDPKRFGAWGPSAGGHLSALLGTSAGVKSLEGTANPAFSSDVQAVCNWFGVTDFTKVPPAFEEPITDDTRKKYGRAPWYEYTYATHQLLNGSVSQNLSLAALANPINYIDAGDPPFLIVHGELDKIVPISQSNILAEALNEKGVEVTYVRLRERKHTHAGKEGERFDPKLIDMAVEFFDKHLKAANKKS